MMTTFTRKMLAGLLLGAMLLPLQAPPVQAQFGFGIVHDPAAYALQVSKRLEEALRWVETIQYYAQFYTNMVQQLTTLRGVLGIVDTQLAKDMQTAMLTYRIGQILHGARLLKNQVETTVRYEIGALRQIDDRLRNGIFDMGRDRADFEEYLWYTMGRNSRQTMQVLKKTIQADAQLSKWMTERDQMMTELYAAEATKRALEARLEQEQPNLDAYAISALTQSLESVTARILTLKEQIRGLDELIEKRVNEYGLTVAEMENLGYPTRSTKLGWEASRQAQANIAATFDVSIRRIQ
ncbi:MAG TPA: hypothetical protein VJ302_19595 [Blastocatellia bacterium]|nr:hypothetical protein [Blastocatellia bacterium]